MRRYWVLLAEKASAQAQEGFREEAALLLKTILEKNDDFGDRRVGSAAGCFCPLFPTLTTHTMRRYPRSSSLSLDA